MTGGTPRWKLQSVNLTLQGNDYVGQVGFANENAGGQFSPRTLVLSVKPNSNKKLIKITSDIAKSIESFISPSESNRSQNLLSLGFKHNASDNTYAKKIDSQFSLEVDESGKIHIVADAEETGIASMGLTEELISSFREVMFKVKNQTAI